MDIDDMPELKLCCKTRYASEENIKKAIIYLTSKDSEVILDYYKCHICHNFHLTSKGYTGG